MEDDQHIQELEVKDYKTTLTLIYTGHLTNAFYRRRTKVSRYVNPKPNVMKTPNLSYGLVFRK